MTTTRYTSTETLASFAEFTFNGTASHYLSIPPAKNFAELNIRRDLAAYVGAKYVGFGEVFEILCSLPLGADVVEVIRGFDYCPDQEIHWVKTSHDKWHVVEA